MNPQLGRRLLVCPTAKAAVGRLLLLCINSTNRSKLRGLIYLREGSVTPPGETIGARASDNSLQTCHPGLPEIETAPAFGGGCHSFKICYYRGLLPSAFADTFLPEGTFATAACGGGKGAKRSGSNTAIDKRTPVRAVRADVATGRLTPAALALLKSLRFRMAIASTNSNMSGRNGRDCRGDGLRRPHRRRIKPHGTKVTNTKKRCGHIFLSILFLPFHPAGDGMFCSIGTSRKRPARETFSLGRRGTTKWWLRGTPEAVKRAFG